MDHAIEEQMRVEEPSFMEHDASPMPQSIALPTSALNSSKQQQSKQHESKEKESKQPESKQPESKQPESLSLSPILTTKNI